jgi:uncharacterized protein (TIGR03067 family)
MNARRILTAVFLLTFEGTGVLVRLDAASTIEKSGGAVEEPALVVDKAILGVWELSNDDYVKGMEWAKSAGRHKMRWEFTATELIIDPGRSRLERKSSYRLDPARAGAIDLLLNPEGSEKVSLGIYKLEGDKLIICVGKAGGNKRPADFSPASPAERRLEFVRQPAP